MDENRFCPSPLPSLFFRYFLYGALLAAMVFAMDWEARFLPPSERFSESSLIEKLQIVLLAVAQILGWVMARKSPEKKALGIFIAGFALMAMIRELDAFFDHALFDGAWQCALFLVACATFYALWKSPTTKNLPPFSCSSAFGFLTTGAFVVLVISRLMGRSALWRAIMEESYMRIVKNAVEESVELMGYALILLGVIELFWVAAPTAMSTDSKKSK